MWWRGVALVLVAAAGGSIALACDAIAPSPGIGDYGGFWSKGVSWRDVCVMHPALHGLFAKALIKQRSVSTGTLTAKSRLRGSDVVRYHVVQAKLGVLRRVLCACVRVFSAKINKKGFLCER